MSQHLNDVRTMLSKTELPPEARAALARHQQVVRKELESANVSPEDPVVQEGWIAGVRHLVRLALQGQMLSEEDAGSLVVMANSAVLNTEGDVP
jgi:hypothetical protein